MGYDYENLCADIELLMKKYKSISVRIIGKSVMGRNLYCLKIGRGAKRVVLLGAYHGLEYLTAAFLMRFTEAYTECVHNGEMYFGHDTTALFDNVTLFVVPMVNPDGVDIAINGLDITNPYHRNIISMTGIHSFNNVWQANAHGVDLNHNHDAEWSMVVESPSPTKFGGEFPESEPESRAVADFVRKTGIDILLTFHSQGREIYYDFNGMESKLAKTNAEEVAKSCGYKAASPSGTATFGGAKDWYIKEFHKQAYTIELGCGKNPLPQSQLPDMSEDTLRICMELIDRVF